MARNILGIFPARGASAKVPVRTLIQDPQAKEDSGAYVTPQGRSFASINYNDDTHYTSGDWTTTVSGTGAAIAGDDKYDWAKFTTGSATNFYASAQSVSGSALGPVANKIYGFNVMFELADVTKTGFYIGFFPTNTDPFGTAPTSGVAFTKANNAAAVNSWVRGNSGTAVSGSATFTSANTTLYEVGVLFDLGIGTATPKGQWRFGAANAPKTVVQMTVAEATQLAAIITEGPSTWRQSFCFLGTTGANYVARVKGQEFWRDL